MNIILNEFLKTKPKRSSKYYFSIGDILIYKNENIKIINQFKKKDNKYYNVLCLNCNNDFDIREANIFHERGCAFCKNKKVKVGYNDIATTNPILMKYMLNKDDAYKYIKNSIKRIDWICPQCKTIIKNKQILLINNFGLSCPKCSDGVSFPNRVMYNILKQTNYNFESEKEFVWSCHKKYDFYIADINCIIEMQGGFHSVSKFNKDVSIVIENDIFKEKIAINNNIIHYFKIDAKLPTFECIKNNIINSKMCEIIDINKIDWIKCYEDSIKSIIPQVCKEWEENKNITTSEIANNFKINVATVGKYLTIGNELNLCKYTSNLGHQRASNKFKRKIMCTTTGDIFESVKEAMLFCNLKSSSGIVSCINNKRRYAGKHPVTKELLQWEYLII